MTPEQFLDATDLFPDAALYLTAGGSILAANPAVANQFGFGPEELQGKPLGEFTITSADALGQYLSACSRSRQKMLGALTMRRKDGQTVACRAEGKVVLPRSDTSEARILLRLIPREAAVSQFLLLNQRIEDLSREIVRRQKAEEELRAQKEWLQVTLSSIGDGVIATDSQGRVSFLNPVAEALTGWRQEEAVGRPLEEIFDIVNEEKRTRVVNPISRVFAEGTVVGLENHTLLIARGGIERPIDDCGAPIRDGDGQIIGAVLIFHDVTERREMERELLARAEKLVEAGRRKDEWIAMLAHELRGPLSPIRNGVQFLQIKGPPEPDLQQARDMIARQTQHMARIIDDLLDVTRITRGKVHLRQERLDLARLVRTTAEDFRPGMAQAGLALTVDVPETPLWVEGDATRLVQIVNNLLDNACKFTDRGGRVDVKLATDPDGRWVEIHVRDTGAGIELEMVGRLFEPLSQADRSLHRSRGGLGLGLALVKGLTELHGGEVRAHSAGPGSGAEFIVRLPLQEEAPALTQPPPSIGLAGEPLRILVIEDNRDAADSLQLLLQMLGHEVRVAYTGPAGVEAAARWSPQVILSDIGLPGGLDGFGVARELRRNQATSGALFIAITGYGSEDDRRRARESGFDHTLTKPADPSALLGLLAAAKDR